MICSEVILYDSVTLEIKLIARRCGVLIGYRQSILTYAEYDHIRLLNTRIYRCLSWTDECIERIDISSEASDGHNVGCDTSVKRSESSLDGIKGALHG